MVTKYTFPDGPGGSPLTNEERLVYCTKRFNQDYPTERDATEEICRRILDNGVTCSFCESTDVTREPGSRSIRCNNCKKVDWITKGTIFRYRKKLHPRLFCLMLMENRVCVSKREFSRVTGVDYGTAHLIFLEFATVLEETLNEGLVSLQSKLFSIVFCKRSRETPARMPPVAEQEEMEKMAGRSAAGQSQSGQFESLGATTSNSEDQSGNRNREERQRHEILSEDLKKVIHNAIDNAMNKTNSGTRMAQSAKSLFNALSDEPVYIDLLLERSGLQIGDFLAALFPLETLGLIEQ